MEVGESGELRGGDITACTSETALMNRRRGALIVAPDPKTVQGRLINEPIGPVYGPAPRLSSSPARTELTTILEGIWLKSQNLTKKSHNLTQTS